MFKRYLPLIFIGLLIITTNFQTISAQSGIDKSIEKIKADIYRRESEGAKVVVKLKNGRKLKGYISKVREDSFDVTDYKIKQITTILYRDIRQVDKKQGLPIGAKIAIGIGIAAVVTVVVIRASVKRPSGGFCIGCGPLF